MEIDIIPALSHFESAGIKITLTYKPSKAIEPRYSPEQGMGDIDYIFERLQSL
jgi:hypothetical protein